MSQLKEVAGKASFEWHNVPELSTKTVFTGNKTREPGLARGLRRGFLKFLT